ncbi:acyltransferase [Sphingosinicella sp. BN140058]|uniref:acyltransferase family protein n=1 Tax=Sphingosinicella sp. BN140058 TaxID=1892855 RepID=UPI001010ECB9|nr:acyltransferase [Sphingosinicella sp. BN140058]QAY77481.1 acyltransferase [Sphingosinicella sp. BN140058]
MSIGAASEHRSAAGAALPRLDGLQLGRAVAACSVVISHAFGHYNNGTHGIWTMLSGYGVTLFFVISGYIMVLTTGRESFSPRAFLSRRIRRIVPIYYIANMVLAVATLLAPWAFKRTTFDAWHVVQSLLFIPAYDPAGSGYIWPFFRLGWTLNYEMFFYLIFASLFALGVVQRALSVTLVLGGLILLGMIHPFSAAIPNFYTQVATIGFIFGTLTGMIALYRPIRLNGFWSWIAALLSFAMLAVMASMYEQIRRDPATQLWLSIACTLHIVLLVSLVDGRGRAVPKSLLYVGDASYSIYLFHMFAVGAATAVAHRLPSALLYPALALSACSGILAGLVAYRFVEAPLNRYFRYRRPLTAAEISAPAAATEPPVAGTAAR